MMLPISGSRNHRPHTADTGLWRPSRWYMFSISLGIVNISTTAEQEVDDDAEHAAEPVAVVALEVLARCDTSTRAPQIPSVTIVSRIDQPGAVVRRRRADRAAGRPASRVPGLAQRAAARRLPEGGGGAPGGGGRSLIDHDRRACARTVR